MTTVADLADAFEAQWPIVEAENWDRPGLVIGEAWAAVRKVLLTVDITQEIITDAIAIGAQLVFSHHPILLRDADSLTQQPAKSAMLERASAAGLAIYAAHTNADITESGVSASLARAIGLRESRPLVPATERIGHGRIGQIEPTSLLSLARKVAASLPATAGGVRVSGDPDQLVGRIALCAGAGDSFIADAIEQAADVFITSDLRHHVVQEAVERCNAIGKPFSLIDISHWAAESIWLETACLELAQQFPQVTFEVSDLRTDPWDFLVTQ